MLRGKRTSWSSIMLALALAACGGDPTGPTEIPYGQTTLVFVVNPVVNDMNEATLPTVGTVRSGITVSIAGGPSGTTDAKGVVVLTNFQAGAKSVAFNGPGLSDTLTVSIADKDLREVAVSLTDAGAQVLSNVGFPFGGTVVEVNPLMSVAEVNDALAQSSIIVFFKAGTYTGDLVFAGSNTTLFGEGVGGGKVIINGNVTISGSGSQVRGTRILKNLTAPGSELGFSFGAVVGAVSIDGSSPVLLNNAFCGSMVIAGSGATVLGNAGLAPVPAPAGGC